MCENKVAAACDIACCGADCANCTWKEKSGCKGCRKALGQVWWGECMVAQCALNRGIEHCGKCDDMPCSELKSIIDHPVHGDFNERYDNLKIWSDREDKPHEDN